MILELTFYCCCFICTRSNRCKTYTGVTPVDNFTLACDRKIYPMGSVFEIDGRPYMCQDTGGKIKGNRIDIYVSSHSHARKLGKVEKEVKLLRLGPKENKNEKSRDPFRHD